MCKVAFWNFYFIFSWQTQISDQFFNKFVIDYEPLEWTGQFTCQYQNNLLWRLVTFGSLPKLGFGMLEHERNSWAVNLLKLRMRKKDFMSEKIISFLIHGLWGFFSKWESSKFTIKWPVDSMLMAECGIYWIGAYYIYLAKWVAYAIMRLKS